MGLPPFEARRPACMGRVHFATHAPVAQLDRALPSGGRGQRFESSRARHHIISSALNPLIFLRFRQRCGLRGGLKAQFVATFVATSSRQLAPFSDHHASEGAPPKASRGGACCVMVCCRAPPPLAEESFEIYVG
jgi:hypothetical protein